MIYLQLFATFFVIGLFTFGGGVAMLSLIQTQVVTKFGWLTEAQFTDIVAISQCTPGPIGVNCATYTGYEVAGVAGSALATFALVLPSFIIFYGIITLYNRYHNTSLFSNVMTGLRPAVAGLIGAAALMRPTGISDMEVKSLNKKFKDKKFAAGCDREVIRRGAEMLGMELSELFGKTLDAMRACEC